jgi:hypothetical protein
MKEVYEIGLKESKDLCDKNWDFTPAKFARLVLNELRNFPLLKSAEEKTNQPQFDFTSGEDNDKIVEYYLLDDGGCSNRCSPFIMPVGTEFEHEYGRYKVTEIKREAGQAIKVVCERLTRAITMF